MTLADWPLSPYDVRLIRARISRKSQMRPFILFCGENALKAILDGTGLDFETVKAHSREIKPDLWAYTVAWEYTGNETRRALGLTSIAKEIG
jgi:hypothetical protein